MRKLDVLPVLRSLLNVLLLTACQPNRPDQSMDVQAGQPAASPDDQAEPTQAAPSTLLTLQPSTAGEATSATELLAAISPAVALFDTPLGTGSAILIQDNYLLTSAHVVWPNTEVRVVSPDGSEYPAAPVDPGDLPFGSDVYIDRLPRRIRSVSAAHDHGRHPFAAVQLGDEEKAAKMIDEAMAQKEESELALEAPDPQLASLLEMAAAFSGEEAQSQ